MPSNEQPASRPGPLPPPDDAATTAPDTLAAAGAAARTPATTAEEFLEQLRRDLVARARRHDQVDPAE